MWQKGSQSATAARHNYRKGRNLDDVNVGNTLQMQEYPGAT